MKKVLSFIIAAFTYFAMYAQEADSFEKKFLLNFVVPDMPAYKGLGIEKSDLLRPADIKDFAVMLSPFYNNGKGVIPKNFGIEFAPWKMASRKWTLKDYNDKGGKRFLYNSSFSLATVNDSTVYASKVAIGYRVSILSNKADIIRIVYDESAVLKEKADDALKLKDNLETYWITKKLNLRPPLSDYVKNHQEEFYIWLSKINIKDKTNDKELKELIMEAIRIFGESFSFADFKKMKFDEVQSKLIEMILLEYKNKNWNASRFDAALSFVGESKDSLLSNSRFSSFNVWATHAFKINKKGQLLIGLNLKLPNSSIDSIQSTPISFSFSSRMLLGNSNFRFFGESQWKTVNYSTITNSILLNLGAEIRLSERMWISASSGVDNLKDRKAGNWYNQLAANLDLRYGF